MSLFAYQPSNLSFEIDIKLEGLTEKLKAESWRQKTTRYQFTMLKMTQSINQGSLYKLEFQNKLSNSMQDQTGLQVIAGLTLPTQMNSRPKSGLRTRKLVLPASQITKNHRFGLSVE